MGNSWSSVPRNSQASRRNVSSAGAVYVFDLPVDGRGWTQASKLQAPDASTNGYEYFGREVAIYGNRVAVWSAAGQGTIYMFGRASKTSWVLQTTFTPAVECPGTCAMQEIFWSVAMSSSRWLWAQKAH
mmetsp:Transcript_4528/g.9030  ORF Transcript_4528/g.9030 Transcript_4528/m.9030 type:complete len:129 (+) Transcript_4528:1768-2154(+)